MKTYRKRFGNKIVALALILLLFADTFPFTSYAVNGENNNEAVEENVETDEPDGKEDDIKENDEREVLEEPNNKENDNEIYEETEVEDPEIKDLEIKEGEIKEPETKTPEIRESEIRENEINENEISENEISEIEIKNLEIKETETSKIETERSETEESKTERSETEGSQFSEIESTTIEDSSEEITTYEVTIFKEGEGVIEIDKTETLSVTVEEGKSVEITITPKDSYRVEDILIDNSSVIQNQLENVSYEEKNDNTSSVIIENITASKYITVKFEDVGVEESKTIDDLLHILEEPGIEKGRLIPPMGEQNVQTRIYSKTTKLVITDADKNNNVQFRIKKKGESYEDWDEAPRIESTCELEEVQMRTKDGLDARVVKCLSNIKIEIDKEPPNLELTYETRVFDHLLGVLTFNLFSRYEIEIIGKATDTVSDIDEENNPVEYYRVDKAEMDTSVLSREELDKKYEEGEFSKDNNIISAQDGTYVVIYARAVDRADNVKYVCTDGIIFDNTNSEIIIEPEKLEQPTAHESDGYGIYTEDFNLDITVSEIKEGDSQNKIYSGIKTVKYSIKKEYTDKDPEYTVKDEVLFNYEPDQPDKKAIDSDFVELDESKQFVYRYSGSIRVPVEKNEHCKICIEVYTVDNAGNETVSQDLTIKDENGETQIRKWLDIDSVEPVVSISYKDNNQNDSALKANYYNTDITATLEIRERTAHFEPDAAINAVRITSTDADGKPTIICTKEQLLAEGFLLTDQWTTIEGDTPDEAIHLIDFRFADEAAYKFEFNYTQEDGNQVVYADKAGNHQSNQLKDEFVVDKTAPTGKVTIVPKRRDESGNISSGEASKRSEKDRITEEVLFGFSNVSIDVHVEGSDNISPETAIEIEYYKTDSPEPMSEAELDKAAFQEFHPSVFSEEERMILYFKISDEAGNYTYLRSDGWIIDKSVSTVVKFEPLNITQDNEPVFYNSDIEASVEINDDYSGIKKIEYWVVKDGKTQTQREVLVPEKDQDNASNEKIVYSKIIKNQVKRFTVDSAKNNSCDVEVFVKVTDNAGNAVTQSKKYDIDITPPEITITFDRNNPVNKSYFNSDRTATIRIKEREHHFDGNKVVDGIRIVGYDSKKKQLSGINKNEMISGWTLEKGDNPDDAVFTAQIKFTKDANYKFTFHNAEQEEEKNKYRDKAGNLSGEINWEDSVAVEEFTIDKTKPVVSVTASPQGGGSKTWEKLLNSRTFAIWSNSGIGVSASYEDATAGIDKVQYYKSTASGAESEKSLSGKSWHDFRSLTISPNEQAAIYLKVTDKAGNTTYVSTDGLVADNMAPTINLRLEMPETGIYNSDATVFVDVQEALSNEQYSGLKTISYKVLNMGKETQNGTLFSFSEQAPSRSQLSGRWTGEIKVDSSLNNSNDVVVEVYASDNAQNTATQKTELQIDVTKPTIEVSYDKNVPDSEKYYNEPRTATIIITERNFDAKDVAIHITNEDQTIPLVSEWVKKEGDGNLDNTTHTATITYSDDGDYTFDIDYIDIAENECEGAVYAEGTVNETAFTIDKTLPEIRVTYDNNDARNNEYFNEGRTATITVTEHNFDVARVNLTQTALLEGRTIQIPNARWQDDGDVHTAVIPYLDDGDYTFDVSMSDLAGNENGGVNYAPENASKNFTIDTVIEEPVITGVENGKAYKGDVVPVVTLSDANFDSYEATLTRTRLAEKDVDVTEQFISSIPTGSTGGSGEYSNFEAVQENDGIYTLYVKMNDKAGNESESTVQFTLNRFGSVYAYNDYLIDLIKNGGGYVRSVDEDLVITEYNADKLVNGSIDIEITRDGKPLESPEYTISPEANNYVSVGESGWYQYRYDISSRNFENDGIYKISVASKDETGNAPENTNYKDKAILFTVDSAAPEITSVTGLENSIVNASELAINYTVYDTVGIKSVRIYLDGNLFGDEITDFGEDINNYAGTFVIQEADKSQNVRIVVEDLAGNITDTSSEDFKSAYVFHGVVTVSTNMFVRLFANKLLVWSGLGMLAVIMAAVSGAIVYKKKRTTERN